MAQISYGTITITDTNDIESIIVEYARNQSTSSAPTSGWSTTRPTWEQGYYIWQRTRTHKAGTSTDSDTYGTAVCITGSTGQTGGTGAAGRSLTNTVTQYTTATNSATITQSNMGNYTWSSNVPSYSSSTPAYWVRVTNTYSNPSSTEYIIYKDNGLTDAIAKSVEANNNAAMANSIAQHANENAQGAMSQAIETQYQTEALAAKVKNYWWDSTGAHIASGIVRSGQTEADDVITTNSTTYGFNSLVGLTGITFGYNSFNNVKLDASGTPVLNFYQPSKTTQGNLTMSLSSNALTFYNPVSTTPNASNVCATLNSNGLILKEGGIKAGLDGQNGFIYVSSEDYQLKDSTHNGITINGHTPTAAGVDGKINNDAAWRQIIGTNFGVDANGILYAQDAVISGQITVGGVNGYDVQEALDNTIIFDTSYEFDNLNPHQTVTFTAHVYRGGVDITSSFYDEDFTWFYKTENNSTALPINTNTNNQNNGKTITFNLSNIGYGCEIVGKFEPTSEANLLDNSNNNLTDSNNTSLTTQTTESGNSVRVRDLSYITTLQQSDAIMAITSNSEKLITIANLANALQTTSVQIVRW